MNRKTLLEQELKRILETILRDYFPERVILFGSLAQGNVHEWSDIDLAVVKKTPRRFLDRISDVLELTHPQVSLNVVIYTPQEVERMQASRHYFWIDEISKKGRIFYDQST